MDLTNLKNSGAGIAAYGVLFRDNSDDTAKIVLGQQVDGGYFVCETLPTSGTWQKGQLCYCTGTAQTPVNKFYQYTGTGGENGWTESSVMNQNAFSNVKVGNTTIAADSITDTIEFAGSNITITPNTTNDKVTFSVADGTTSAKGIVQLSSTTGSAENVAATPKGVQAAIDALDVSEPTASGTSTTFIATAKQENGKIVVTKASLPNYAGSASKGGPADKVANALTIKFNSGTNEGTNKFTYDGSAAKTVDIKTTDADVKLSAPFTFTSSFGNYTVTAGQVRQYGTTGQSLHDFLQNAFSQDETTVFASSPSYSISISGSTEGEIGSTVTPSASWSTSAGTFKYGTYNTGTSSADFTDKTTGITYTTGTISTASGSGITLGNTVTYSASGKKLKVTGTISRTALTKHPCSKLGTDTYDKVDSTYKSAITNQTVSNEKTFTGYRKMFMGATSSTAAIDGALIRSLFNGSTTTGFKAQALSNKEIKADSTDTKIIWAIPSSFKVTSIKFEYEPNKNDWKTLTSAGITSPLTIKVAGAGSDTGENYTVYVCAPAAGGAFGGQGINTRITIS